MCKRSLPSIYIINWEKVKYKKSTYKTTNFGRSVYIHCLRLRYESDSRYKSYSQPERNKLRSEPAS